MATHRHNIRKICQRTVNGRPVARATILETDGIYQAQITDIYGSSYVSGSNGRDLSAERQVLRDMLDPALPRR
jgi:hypothetical protein